ncbi:uncharacterized protein LOC143546509 [Bidens hawaiensis]|uniref:uncharacterized protein LOC143546509 n=1 Tax=Bidens hawaiensis TaxID=980011 RepID=UPI00404AB734
MAIDTQKPRWSELEEDDDSNDYNFLLPPKQVIGLNEHGEKKVIEYKFNEDGDQVKITTRFGVRKVANARVSKRAVERRSWVKFGDAVQEDVGARLTMVSTEDIVFDRPRAQGTKAEESTSSGDPLAQMSKGGATLMLCRTCGTRGDHWTSRCPYKDLAQPIETFVENPNPTDPTNSGPTKSGAYVPPTRRDSAARLATGVADMRRRNDENLVRVNNLSEDTREADLRELFQPFGNVSRAYVAIDQKTGMSRGFGFVNFVRREDCERAITKLNGYGYDNLILSVEWAAPRAN